MVYQSDAGRRLSCWSLVARQIPQAVFALHRYSRNSEGTVMAKQKNKSNQSRKLHPGSSAEDAKKVGGKGDFGAAENDRAARDYTSRNTKRSDRGGAEPHSGDESERTSGVGGNASGAGSSSGGDLDTDIVG